MAYFQRMGPERFQPLPTTSGAWNTQELHIAPVIGLLTHVLEQAQAARGTGLSFGRLSYDILGPIPMEPLDVRAEVIRPGRTVELWEAVVECRGRAVLRARAWAMAAQDTSSVAGTPIAPIPPRTSMTPYDPTQVWEGGFIQTVEIVRDSHAVGHAAYWARLTHPLLVEEPIGPLAAAATIFDIANGMTVRMPPEKVAFPNLDLTVHLWDTLPTDWLGFETRVSFGPQGLGMTHSVLFGPSGAVGMLAQSLTLRLRDDGPV